MAGGLPMSACLSVLLLCLAHQASTAASGPPIPQSWLGNWAGYCLTKVVFRNGVPNCSKDESRIIFRISLTWNTTTRKLEYIQNVTGVAKGSSSLAQLVPTHGDKMTLTLNNQTTRQPDNTASKPVCLSIDGTGVNFAMVVVPNDGSGRPQYLEESVYTAVDPVTFMPTYTCPSKWSSLQTAIFYNNNGYNYECMASPEVTTPPTLPMSPSPEPSPSQAPSAVPVPSPSPSPMTPTSLILPTPPLLLASPSPSSHIPLPSTPKPSPPVTQSETSDVSTNQQVVSTSPTRTKRTAILAGTISGAVGLIVLVAAVAVCWQRSQDKGKAWQFSSLLSSTNIDDSGMKGYVTLKMTPTEQLLPPTIPGLMPGDPFLRTTAPQYKWTNACPASSISVESGITDTQLDTMAVDGVSPAVQLSSTEVQQQLELLTDGLLGRGGAALVFKCLWRQRFSEGLLAIKLLKDAFNTSVSVLQSFTYEAELLSTIRHPHIVKLYGYCLEPPHVCLIMELLPTSLDRVLYPAESAEQSTGQQALSSSTPGSSSDSKTQHASPSSPSSATLGSSNATHAPATVSVDVTLQADSKVKTAQLQQQSTLVQQWTMLQVLKMSIDVAAALTYLHDRQNPILPGARVVDITSPVSDKCDGPESQYSAEARASKVVHRDLKPANVLINSNGQAKLSDFGLAREHMSTTVHTMRVNVGTLHYMAPELLALSATKPTNRVDIYSLGIMMWELVAQQKPWHDMYKEQMITAVLSGRRPPLPTSKGLDMQSAADMKVTDWSQVPADFSACPEYVDLVRECWHQRDYKRPAAAEVLRRLQAVIREGCEQAHENGSLPM